MEAVKGITAHGECGAEDYAEPVRGQVSIKTGFVRHSSCWCLRAAPV